MAASSSDDAQAEIAKLKEMAATARAEAAALATELGYKDAELGTGGKDDEDAAPPKPKKSNVEIATAIQSIDFMSGSAATQLTTLDALKADGSIAVYKSATVEGGAGDLRHYPVSLQMLANRANGLDAERLGIGEEEVSLDDFKYGTLWLTGGCTVGGIASLAFLPENIGATFCYSFALIPILWLGVGSTVPAAIASLLVLLRGQDEDGVDPQARICRHEAAHFLIGYLCGLPIATYDASSDDQIPRVEFYYSSNPHDVATVPTRELTSDEVNALTVVALSGAVAEAMAFTTAKGGNQDLVELQAIFKKSSSFLGAQKQQDLTRWGALTAYKLLNDNKASLDLLCQAFQEQKSVADCVTLLEQHKAAQQA